MKINPIWFDGFCNVCGSNVYERGSESEKDYENACSNENCTENRWHQAYDDEELDYYTHIRPIPAEKIVYLVSTSCPKVFDKIKDKMI